MITIKLKGGLGNQMFQYATGKALALRNHTTLTLDVRGYDDQSDKVTPRTFALDVFNIHADLLKTAVQPKKINALQKLLYRIFRKFRHSKKDHYCYFDEKVYRSKDGAYLNGYFQNERYFINERDLITNDFRLNVNLGDKALAWKDEILTCQNSISLHIRRGDYVSNTRANNYHETCNAKYYKQAYEILEQNLQSNMNIFIFSDDIDWVKKNINFPSHTHTYFVSDSEIKDYEELYLMSLTEHHIIANSTFSWWGAWLGEKPNSIVIAPNQWNKLTAYPNTPVPERWIKIL